MRLSIFSYTLIICFLFLICLSILFTNFYIELSPFFLLIYILWHLTLWLLFSIQVYLPVCHLSYSLVYKYLEVFNFYVVTLSFTSWVTTSLSCLGRTAYPKITKIFSVFLSSSMHCFKDQEYKKSSKSKRPHVKQIK